MNRNYVREDDDMTTQQQISNDFEDATRFARGLVFALGAMLLLVLAAWGAAANAQAVNTATITFQASTAYTDGTAYPTGAVVTYDLYQGIKGATRVKVGTVTSGGSITTGLLTGNEYCWDVVTVLKVGTASAIESDHSLAACKNFAGKPGVVIITVT